MTIAPENPPNDWHPVCDECGEPLPAFGPCVSQECAEPKRVECPCCHGNGVHVSGSGPNEQTRECWTCRGCGEIDAEDADVYMPCSPRERGDYEADAGGD